MTIHQEPIMMKPGDTVVWPDTVYHALWTGEVLVPLCQWDSPGIGPAIDAAFEAMENPTPLQVQTEVMEILESFGYDSIDRESSFQIACAKFGMTYEDIYQAWLNA